MATKKLKGLGRGLEALLGPKVSENAADDSATSSASPGLPASLRLVDLVPGRYQPRTHMDEGALYELAESIKAQGIMQPILVRQLKEGANQGLYEIIAGERRFRAARLAGLDSVPVLVRDVPNEAAAAMAFAALNQRVWAHSRTRCPSGRALAQCRLQPLAPAQPGRAGADHADGR